MKYLASEPRSEIRTGSIVRVVYDPAEGDPAHETHEHTMAATESRDAFLARVRSAEAAFVASLGQVASPTLWHDIGS